MSRQFRFLVFSSLFLSLPAFRSSFAVEFLLKPVGADVPHSIIDGALHVMERPARIELEVFLRDWDRDGNGVPLLRTFQYYFDIGSLSSGQLGSLQVLNVPCDDNGDCAGVAPVPECVPYAGEPARCITSYQDTTRDDWVHRCCTAIAACNPTGSCGSTTLDGGAVDNGAWKYLGSVLLHAAPDAAGTFVVKLDLAQTREIFQVDPPDATDPGLAEISQTPSVIHIHAVTACCGANDMCHDALSADCATSGGTPLFGALCGNNATSGGDADVCAQDCQPNGVWDPLELTAKPYVDCDQNGLLDACEPQPVPNPLVFRVPAASQTVPRSKGGILAVEFHCPIVMPSPGSVSFRKLLPGGAFGPERGAQLAINRSAVVDPVNDPFGPFRGLTIGLTQFVLETSSWYRIEIQSPGGQAALFRVDLPVLLGDVNGDGFVLNSDVVLANAGVFSSVSSFDRRDVNGDGFLSNADVTFINAQSPRRMPPKPSGH